jgi:hypothetical protein
MHAGVVEQFGKPLEFVEWDVPSRGADWRILGRLFGTPIRIGIPKDSIVKYQTAFTTDQFLLIAHGTAAGVAKAKDIIESTNPAQSTLHATEAVAA